jgi:hypothetical protein
MVSKYYFSSSVFYPTLWPEPIHSSFLQYAMHLIMQKSIRITYVGQRCIHSSVLQCCLHLIMQISICLTWVGQRCIHSSNLAPHKYISRNQRSILKSLISLCFKPTYHKFKVLISHEQCFLFYRRAHITYFLWQYLNNYDELLKKILCNGETSFLLFSNYWKAVLCC